MENLLSQFDAIDDLELLPTFRESLTEFGRVGEGANARISELEALAAELEQKLQSTMAHNYELMRSATAQAQDPDDPTPEPVEDYSDEAADVTELFTEV